jgi:hypothetical protein
MAKNAGQNHNVKVISRAQIFENENNNQIIFAKKLLVD